MKTFVGFLAVVFLTAASVYAATEMLSPGTYMATITPAVDSKAASDIESRLSQIGEIKDVAVKPDDSSVHFTVKEREEVALLRLQDAVKTAAPDRLMGTPAIQREPSQKTGVSGYEP
jgi:hypothetical protein